MNREEHISNLVNILKSRGCFWSYDNQNSQYDEVIIIEKSLLYLDFEDMHMLFSVYSIKKIKKVWKENLLSKGQYYNKINWLLAVLFFNIKRPDSYLKKYGR